MPPEQWLPDRTGVASNSAVVSDGHPASCAVKGECGSVVDDDGGARSVSGLATGFEERSGLVIEEA